MYTSYYDGLGNCYILETIIECSLHSEMTGLLDYAVITKPDNFTANINKRKITSIIYARQILSSSQKQNSIVTHQLNGWATFSKVTQLHTRETISKLNHQGKITFSLPEKPASADIPDCSHLETCPEDFLSGIPEPPEILAQGHHTARLAPLNSSYAVHLESYFPWSHVTSTLYCHQNSPGNSGSRPAVTFDLWLPWQHCSHWLMGLNCLTWLHYTNKNQFSTKTVTLH